MRCLLLVVLAACAAAQTPQPPAKTAAPPALDDAAVISRSKAWLDAFDRFDSETMMAAVGPAFVLFEDARFYDRALLASSVDGRRKRGLPPRTREWDEARVFHGPGVAVFVARSVETILGLDGAPPTTQDGYNTLVWTFDGSRWTLSHFQWARGGLDAERNRWNDGYRQGRGFNKKPNALLVSTLQGRKPGRALDIAMGQGRNAIYIATQKWQTTGIDISDEGIRQAKAEAAAQNVTLETLLADVDTYDLGTAQWDLITLIYAGADPKLVARIKPALKSRGLFVCEYFHADADVAKAGAGGWKTGELAALFADGFEIVRDEVVEDNADWAGMRKTKLVRFVARKK